MRSMPGVAIQHHLLPGRDLNERFANAARYGIDGIELVISAGADLETLVTCAQDASAQSGVAVAAFCTSEEHDPLHPVSIIRRRRFDALTTLLAAADALGATGVVSVPVRPGLGVYEGEEPAQAIAALTEDAIDAFGEWAANLPGSEGGAIFLEPLNRYEAQFLTRVGQAAAIARRIDSPRIRVLGDAFHMNIEEESIPRALEGAGSLLRHIHLADNTRMLPGTGGFDFRGMFRMLGDIGYGGWLSLECFPPADRPLMRDPEIELPATIAFLRHQWAEAHRRDASG